MTKLKLKLFLNLKRKKKFKNFKFLNFLSTILSTKKISLILNYKLLFYNFNNFLKEKLLGFLILRKKNILFLKINNIKLYFRKMRFRRNKFYVIKRKLKKFLHLDVAYEKQFFYSVHIRKPTYIVKKKRKKMLTEKIKPFKLLSLYFGFKKVKKFLLL